MSRATLYLGETWHVPEEPPLTGTGAGYVRGFRRGGLAVDGAGKILAHAERDALLAQFPGATVVDLGGKLILPGFVDAHVHFPQLDLIGSYGEELLGWLERYTYPAEAAFADAGIAALAGDRFVTELLANGTTFSAAYASVHQVAAEALFAACERRGVRAVVGKVSMDREAPGELTQDASADFAANVALIKAWHGRDGRLFSALTPRFAVSCTREMLKRLGDLAQLEPSVFVQSHHAENKAEIATVARHFPEAAHYLDVYGRAKLLGARTVLAHTIHPTDAEVAMLASTQTVVAHCPTSNLFLGSGLFPMRRLAEAGVRMALGTDVGGGTSFSMWRTMAAAYEVQRLQDVSVSPARLFYLATRGGAAAFGMGATFGAFEVGMEADFQVLAPTRSRLAGPRLARESGPEERLFALLFLADDRLVEQVYVRGRRVYGPT